jgi:hypothetical protein
LKYDSLIGKISACIVIGQKLKSIYAPFCARTHDTIYLFWWRVPWVGTREQGPSLLGYIWWNSSKIWVALITFSASSHTQDNLQDNITCFACSFNF